MANPQLEPQSQKGTTTTDQPFWGSLTPNLDMISFFGHFFAYGTETATQGGFPWHDGN